MAFENPGPDPVETELDLQLWAAELGYKYEFGAQGTVAQPAREMSPGRIEAKTGLEVLRMRELGRLAALVDEEERALRVTTRQLARMTPEEREQWHEKAEIWLSKHPGAIKYNLIDRPPKLPKPL